MGVDAQSAGRKGKLWNFNYIYLLAVYAVTGTAFQMMTPIISKYAVSLGASLTVAGTIAGLFAITALAMRPLSGLVADRMNRKWVMVVSTAGMATAVFLYAISANVAQLFAYRVLHGIMFGINSTVNIVLASEFIPRDRLGEGIGYLSLGQILSTSIGPSIGVWLVDCYGYQYCFGTSCAVMLAATLALVFIRYRPQAQAAAEAADGAAHDGIAQPKPEKKRGIRPEDIFAAELIPFMILTALFSFGNGITSAFLALLGKERGIPNVALFFTINALVMLAIRPVAGKLTDRKSLLFILVPSFICATGAMACIGAAGTLFLIIVAAMLRAVGQGAGQPALQAACMRKLGAERAGVASSMYYLGADLGQGVGPMIGGAVSSAYGYSAMYYGAGALMLVGLVAYLLFDRAASAKTRSAQ